MASYNRLVGALDPGEDALTAARRFFEPQLERIGLGQAQVASQSIDQLRVSSSTIKDAIANPQSFGTIKVTYTAQGRITIVSSEQTAHIEIGILPILLERRIQIEDRIKALELEHEVAQIELKLQDIAEPADRDALLAELRVKEDAEQSAKQSIEDAAAKREREARLEVEIQAKRSEIYQSWLARESIASVIGGLLLIVLAVAFVVAMFTRTAVVEVASSAFLLILGYFFGQSTAKANQGA